MTKENQNLQVMESKLAEWRDKIDELQEKAEQTGTSGDVEVNRQFNQLRERYQNLENHLARLKTSGKTQAPDLRDGIENSWDDLIQAFEKLATRYQ